MKFKVGDKVKVIKRIIGIDCPTWVGSMDSTLGTVGVVSKVISPHASAVLNVRARMLVVFANGEQWYYAPESLELISRAGTLKGTTSSSCIIDEVADIEHRRSCKVENIYVNRDKRTTVVEFKDGTKWKVKCGEDEKFDVYTAVTAAISEKIYGSNSALKRAIEEKTIDQKPKKKVGKVSVELECSHVEDATSVLARKIDNAMKDLKKMLEENIKVK